MTDVESTPTRDEEGGSEVIVASATTSASGPSSAATPTYTSMGDVLGADEARYEILGVGAEPGPLTDTGIYRLWACRLPSGQIGFILIAVAATSNDILERMARILRTMRTLAEDEDRAALAREERNPPNYGAFFPHVVEAMLSDDGRGVLIVGLDPVMYTYKQLVPLSVLTTAAGKRVDLQTIVWILGKLLKLMDFVHAVDFTIGLVDPTNELLETEVHGVFVVDFTGADEDPDDATQRAEVVAAAKMAWTAAGGADDAPPPHDEAIMSVENYDLFVALLQRMISGELSALDARIELYNLADIIWPKETKTGEGPDGTPMTVIKRVFHPWTVYDL